MSRIFSDLNCITKLFKAILACAENGGISTRRLRQIYEAVIESSYLMPDDFFVLRCKNSEPYISKLLLYAHTTSPDLRKKIDHLNLSGYCLSDETIPFLIDLMEADFDSPVSYAYCISNFLQIEKEGFNKVISELKALSKILSLDALERKVLDVERIVKLSLLVQSISLNS